MPTIISHAAVPLAIGYGLGSRTIPRPLLAAGVLASMLPDADVIFFRFGATYDSAWAHRGFSHSIGFALALGLIAAMVLRRIAPSAVAFGFVAAAAASHGLLDMLTNGGHGIALLWPATDKRFFFDWRPIQVSPLATGRFVARAARIATTEIFCIWVPAVIVALGLRETRFLQGGAR
ncbi:MAG TPA: metal-dependent hydrolase [Sphingomicrobium sp.]